MYIVIDEQLPRDGSGGDGGRGTRRLLGRMDLFISLTTVTASRVYVFTMTKLYFHCVLSKVCMYTFIKAIF